MIIKEEFEDYGYGYTTNGEPIDESMVDELYRIANEILEKSDLAEEDPYVTIDENSFEYWCDGSSYVSEEFDIIFSFTKPSMWFNDNGMFDFGVDNSGMWDTTAEFEFDCIISIKDGEVVNVDWTYSPTRKDYHAKFDYDALANWVTEIANPVAMDIYNGTTNI